MIIAEHLKRHGCSVSGLVHVGAHLGQEMQNYLDLGLERIVWIEADPDLARELGDRVAASTAPERQTVINSLIADADDCEHDFYKFSNNGESSSLFRSTPVLQERWPTVHETGDILHLRSQRLDTALQNAGVSPSQIDVLVLDVQGAEVLALKGAGGFLDAARFVEVEVSQAQIYAGAPLIDEVSAALRAAGFTAMTDAPWHGDMVFARNGWN